MNTVEEERSAIQRLLLKLGRTWVPEHMSVTKDGKPYTVKGHFRTVKGTSAVDKVGEWRARVQNPVTKETPHFTSESKPKQVRAILKTLTATPFAPDDYVQNKRWTDLRSLGKQMARETLDAFPSGYGAKDATADQKGDYEAQFRASKYWSARRVLDIDQLLQGTPDTWLQKDKLALRDDVRSLADQIETPLAPAAEDGPPFSEWGALYGGREPAYETPEGPVWMFRKGQKVRFLNIGGRQVGPEQSNVAPAAAYAQSQGWTFGHKAATPKLKRQSTSGKQEYDVGGMRVTTEGGPPMRVPSIPELKAEGDKRREQRIIDALDELMAEDILHESTLAEGPEWDFSTPAGRKAYLDEMVGNGSITMDTLIDAGFPDLARLYFPKEEVDEYLRANGIPL